MHNLWLLIVIMGTPESGNLSTLGPFSTQEVCERVKDSSVDMLKVVRSPLQWNFRCVPIADSKDDQ